MVTWEWIGMIGSILLLDLALSGDNALILGATAAGLPYRQRWYALLFGGAGAILLRILFSSVATFVLNIPWLQTIGAVILMVIAIRLLVERGQGQGRGEGQTIEKETRPGREMSFKTAALTILAADVTMSLDNVLAIGAAANGDVWPMALGLLVSIAIIVCGSALVAELMTRFVWLLDLAALVLAWTSATMMHDDITTLANFFHFSWLTTISKPTLPFHLSWLVLLLALVTCGTVGICDLVFHVRSRRKQRGVLPA